MSYHDPYPTHCHPWFGPTCDPAPAPASIPRARPRYFPDSPSAPHIAEVEALEAKVRTLEMQVRALQEQVQRLQAENPRRVRDVYYGGITKAGV